MGHTGTGPHGSSNDGSVQAGHGLTDTECMARRLVIIEGRFMAALDTLETDYQAHKAEIEQLRAENANLTAELEQLQDRVAMLSSPERLAETLSQFSLEQTYGKEKPHASL